MADYICSSSYFVVSMQSESFIFCVHEVKTYGINKKEATEVANGRLEINK